MAIDSSAPVILANYGRLRQRHLDAIASDQDPERQRGTRNAVVRCFPASAGVCAIAHFWCNAHVWGDDILRRDAIRALVDRRMADEVATRLILSLDDNRYKIAKQVISRK
jgi:hypothetical protein